MTTDQPNTADLSSSCPSRGAIQDWLLGSLEESIAAQVELHLELCSQCEDTLATLDFPSDKVIEQLSELPSLDEDELDYQRLRQKLLAEPVSFPDDQLASSFLAQAQRLADPKLGSLPFQIGNYELIECIGRGASGAVYRAQHLKLGRPVAVKVLGASLEDDAGQINRFITEMKLIGSLVHPHIVRATDAGEVEGLHFLVMDYVEGIDVAQLLFRRERLSVPVCCEIVRQAALGLEFAHSKSLIHRDVKPSNLLVTAAGQVKLLDLGVATRVAILSDEQSPAPDNAGTFSYMAPEQRLASSKTDTRADIYGLGKTLFKLLTGASVAANDVSIDDFRNDAPHEVKSLIARMLATDPEDRPATAGEVAGALTPFASHHDLAEAVAKLFPDHARSNTGSDEFQTPSGPHISARKARRRWIVAATGLAVAAVAAARWYPKTGIKKARWRPLKVVDSKLLFSVNERSAKFKVLDDERIEMQSDGIALLRLGQPLLGTFSLHLSLDFQEFASAGVFFRGQRIGQSLTFQTLELDNEPKSKERQPRLLWSRWTATLNDKGENQPATRELLATVEIDPTIETSQHQLQVTCGQRSMPEVRWNDVPLPHAKWQVTAAGQSIKATPFAQLPTAFLGDLGLMNMGGSCVFTKPRLAYQ